MAQLHRSFILLDANAAVVSEHWEKGGAGAVNLANATIETCQLKSDFRFLYPLSLNIRVPFF